MHYPEPCYSDDDDDDDEDDDDDDDDGYDGDDDDDDKEKAITYYPEACQPHLSKAQFKSMHIEYIKSNQIKLNVIKS